jgi:hypothetical protein
MTQSHDDDGGDDSIARVVHLTRVQADWLDAAAEFRLTECRFLKLLLNGCGRDVHL